VTASDGVDADSVAAVRDLTPTAHILRADPSGAIVETLTPETSS
jgi:hypothetical protein